MEIRSVNALQNFSGTGVKKANQALSGNSAEKKESKTKLVLGVLGAGIVMTCILKGKGKTLNKITDNVKPLLDNITKGKSKALAQTENIKLLPASLKLPTMETLNPNGEIKVALNKLSTLA